VTDPYGRILGFLNRLREQRIPEMYIPYVKVSYDICYDRSNSNVSSVQFQTAFMQFYTILKREREIITDDYKLRDYEMCDCSNLMAMRFILHI
jgi:hypothetical protein